MSHAYTPLSGLVTLVAGDGPPGSFKDDWAAFELDLAGWTLVPGKLVDESPTHVTIGVGGLVGSLSKFIDERDPGWDVHAREAVPGGERLAVTQDMRGKPVRLWLAFIAHGPNVLTLRGRDEAAFERAYAALKLLPVPPAEGPGTLVTPEGAFDYPAGWTRDGRFSVRAPGAMVMVSAHEGDLQDLEAYLAEHPSHGRMFSQGTGLLGSRPAQRLVATAFGEDTTVIRLIAAVSDRVVELSLRVEAPPKRLPPEPLAAFEAMAASWR